MRVRGIKLRNLSNLRGPPLRGRRRIRETDHDFLGNVPAGGRVSRHGDIPAGSRTQDAEAERHRGGVCHKTPPMLQKRDLIQKRF
jgi:hypothetical protein